MKPNDTVQPLLDCISDIKKWLSSNFLQLNEEKTKVIIFGPAGSRASLGNMLSHFFRSVSSHVRNLGFIIDSD